ncbi:DNA polymerase-3 subunit epsilon [Hymenobacter luteus]|uniref:DNA polymerase-3 subunit epsilon n=2 Tax=Hymenobacter TaxID=89966 RepID=A0A7W9WBJ3_9BACT|nr:MULTISPECIES: 3'-5' exonuclease [Hymenobacter]MBB4601668.1 DNA polymerase-3 subunit epsilon [Hymenobacter latericoloratus]MBB6059904.1 DNA polymerase-3 subunit epsilon [Hymenobacter luteus]
MAQEYLLFLDTETTGLPRRWDRPYAEEKEWPCIAQLAWVVYTTAGEWVKSDQDYLQIPAGRMPAAAIAIHGLTPEFLREHGQEPAAVLRRLLQDLETYHPRVVGHFLRFDFHVLGAAFSRAGLPNPLPGLPQFCTMKATWPPLSGAPHHRHLRLHELHELLFGRPMDRLHDAYLDAAATARCFFELQRRGLLPPAKLAGQLPLSVPGAPASLAALRWVGVVLGTALLFLLLWLAYG